MKLIIEKFKTDYIELKSEAKADGPTIYWPKSFKRFQYIGESFSLYIRIPDSFRELNMIKFELDHEEILK